MTDDDRTLTANITPFGLRMQPVLKSRVEDAAKANNRSMNAEIVSRLEDTFALDDYSDFPGFEPSVKAAAMAEEMKETKEALALARREAELATIFKDDLHYMSNMLRQMHEEDRATLKEVEEVIYFLEADRVRLEARVSQEKVIPATQDGPGPLKSRIAKRLAWAVDERMGLFARLVARLAPKWKSSAERRAQVSMHSVELSSYGRELAEIFTDEGAGAGEEFVEYVISMIDNMPEDRQEGYRKGLREVMPRLFNEWKGADPLFR